MATLSKGKVKLIFNPTAGRGRAARQVQAVEATLRRLGAVVESYATRDAADLTRAAAESSRRDYDRVVVCGGDGTVHHALREFDLTRGVLGIVPLGSGDDLARVLGIPRNVEGACDAIVNGVVREIDIAVANGIRFAGVAGLGFDSEVAAVAQRVKWLRGSAVYLWSIFRVLPRFAPRRVRMTIDGVTRDQSIMFAVVGNSSQYGGGIRIVPGAKIDDRVFDFCVVHRTSRFQLLKTLPLAYSGGHVKRSYVETGRGREFRFESEAPLDVYADGEHVTTTPVTIGLGGRLRVAVSR